MKKLFSFSSGIFFSLLFLFLFSPRVLAYEGQCHLEPCFVPAPTLLIPGDGEIVTTTRPVIRGLTWKAAIAQIYLDGVELKNVLQKEHQDYYSGLFVVPNFDLAPGPHILYAIAHSEKPGWGDQSVESTYIDFTVVAPIKKTVQLPKATIKEQPVLPITTAPSLEEIKTEPVNQQATTTASSPQTFENKNIATGQVQVLTKEAGGQVEIKEQGEIGGGVAVTEEKSRTATNSLQTAAGLSDLGNILKDEFKESNSADKARANRLIGLVILAIILLIGLVWLIVGRERRLKQLLEKHQEPKEEFAPMPESPFDSAQGVPPFDYAEDMPIDFEATPENPRIDLDRYQVSPEWGSGEKIPKPPISPNSPYPASVNEDKEQERLGL